MYIISRCRYGKGQICGFEFLRFWVSEIRFSKILRGVGCCGRLGTTYRLPSVKFDHSV